VPGLRRPQLVAPRDEFASEQTLEGACLGEQEALSGDAAQAKECLDLLLEFDALGHGVEA